MVSYSTYSEEALASFPTLDPEDVASAAIYILTCAPHVVVSKSSLEIDLLGNAYLKILHSSSSIYFMDIKIHIVFKLYFQVQDIVLRPLGESW